MVKVKAASVAAVASKGGKARAAKLSPEERTELSRRAAEARWGSTALRAVCGSMDRPLRLADMEIPCFVLEDGRRVLAAAGLMASLDMSAGKGGVVRVAALVRKLGHNSPAYKRLIECTENPIRFVTPSGGRAMGFDATMLPDLCQAVLEARRNKLLHFNQAHIANRCEVLQGALARVGIIALVDEATGYQDVRAKDALAKILEQFVAKELQPWQHTFDAEYYKQIFRLNEWRYGEFGGDHKRPMAVARITRDVVYSRLAPGVLRELLRVSPRYDNGRLKQPLHRRLTEEIGHPKLREQIAVVKALMQISNTWEEFTERLDLTRPKVEDNDQFPFMTAPIALPGPAAATT